MTALSPNQQAKILTADVRRILDAVQTGGGEARVVGGAVRDVIMDRATGDIDLAANLPPQNIIEILNKQGIKTVPTGIDHGTITAVIDHTGYEITSLRCDVETDGRHAQVTFTKDWQADAARRDFTFNALYVDGKGTIYDYFGGKEDAIAGRVRFIGDARARITEDILRILRFFRFTAWFGRGEPDAEGLAACTALADQIPRLSAQRVARETLKLLAAPDPAPVWQVILDKNIHKYFLSEVTTISRLRQLVEKEQNYRATPEPLLRLAALLPENVDMAAAIAERLKFSNREAEQLRAFVSLSGLLRGNLEPQSLRRILYQYGAENTGKALLLAGEDVEAARAVIATWENPVFPVKGEDVVKSGIPAGAKVGEILHAVESWWIAGDFRADRAACMAQIERYGKNH